MSEQKYANEAGFDQLLRGYYGDHRRHALRMPPGARQLPADAASLLAAHFGKPLSARYRSQHEQNRQPTTMAVTMTRDDGEVLGAAARDEEYVLSASTEDAAPQSHEDEYVVAPVPVLALSLLQPLTDVLAENRTDILQPLNPLNQILDDPAPTAPVAPSTGTSAAPSVPGVTAPLPTAAPVSADHSTVITPPDATPPAKLSLPAAEAGNGALPTATATTSTAAPTGLAATLPDATNRDSLAAATSISHNSNGAGRDHQDEFIADMEAILSGKKVFDPASKKTVGKEQFAPAQENMPVMHGSDSKNPQAIFDKIAQSMQFANSYDLGTVELENRFADFDRVIDEKRQTVLVNKDSPAAPAVSEPNGGINPAPDAVSSGSRVSPSTGSGAAASSMVGTAEFIRDLDALRQSSAGTAATPLAQPASVIDTQIPSAKALDTGHGADLTGAFVTTSLQTLFANTAEIEQYFSALGATGFIGWFNAQLANRGAWSGKSIGSTAQGNFSAIWNRITQIFGGPQINLLQFLSLMSIFINEVGGALGPVSERVGTAGHPGLAYAFDSISSIPKVSYNDGGDNQTAYQCFRNADFITAHGAKPLGAQWARTDDARWSGHVYPAAVPTDVNPALTGFIMEADFYKFRGRGLIQTTWRGSYERLIAWVQSYAGTQPEILTRQQSWAGLTTARAAHFSANTDWDALFMHTDLEVACVAVAQHSAHSGNYLNLSGDVQVLNGRQAGSIWMMGKHISGGASYANLFRSRVIALCNQLGNTDV